MCAARSCPPLWNRAYTGDEIEEQLSAAMRRFVVDPKQCRIDVARREIRISKVFEWYGADFVDKKFAPHADSIAAFLAPYVPDEEVREALLSGTWNLTHFDYDWSLNIGP